MRVEVEEPVEASKLHALREDVLRYSSSTLTPRHPSLSICPSTPTSPRSKDGTKLPSHSAAPASLSPVPLKSPSFVLRPESPCCDQSSPARSTAQRALRGFTTLLAPPADIPAEPLNGHPRPEHLRARESPMRDPFCVAFVRRPCRDDDCDADVDEEEDAGPGGGGRAR